MFNTGHLSVFGRAGPGECGHLCRYEVICSSANRCLTQLQCTSHAPPPLEMWRFPCEDSPKYSMPYVSNVPHRETGSCLARFERLRHDRRMPPPREKCPGLASTGRAWQWSGTERGATSDREDSMNSDGGIVVHVTQGVIDVVERSR